MTRLLAVALAAAVLSAALAVVVGPAGPAGATHGPSTITNGDVAVAVSNWAVEFDIDGYSPATSRLTVRFDGATSRGGYSPHPVVLGPRSFAAQWTTGDERVAIVRQVELAESGPYAVETVWLKALHEDDDVVPAVVFPVLEGNLGYEQQLGYESGPGVLFALNDAPDTKRVGVAPCGAVSAWGAGDSDLVWDEIDRDALGGNASAVGEFAEAAARVALGGVAAGQVVATSFVHRLGSYPESVFDAASRCPTAIGEPPLPFIDRLPDFAVTSLTLTKTEIRPLYYVFIDDPIGPWTIEARIENRGSLDECRGMHVLASQDAPTGGLLLTAYDSWGVVCIPGGEARTVRHTFRPVPFAPGDVRISVGVNGTEDGYSYDETPADNLRCRNEHYLVEPPVHAGFAYAYCRRFDDAA